MTKIKSYKITDKNGVVPRMRAAVGQIYKMAARDEDIFLS